MTALPKIDLPQHKMAADEFVEWCQRTPGRYELVNGQIEVMQSERVEHAEVKFAVQEALKAAIKDVSIDCRMLPDGIVVRATVDDVFEPDALVYCGPRLPRGSLEVPNPIIVVEVVSPSTSTKDAHIKLAGYFQLPSVQHYLIVNPTKLLVVHHARQGDGTILTRIAVGGSLTMSPPGITISIDHLLD